MYLFFPFCLSVSIFHLHQLPVLSVINVCAFVCAVDSHYLLWLYSVKSTNTELVNTEASLLGEMQA